MGHMKLRELVAFFQSKVGGGHLHRQRVIGPAPSAVRLDMATNVLRGPHSLRLTIDFSVSSLGI